jgi:hypothetical protein
MAGKSKRRKIDWEKIEGQYRAGQLSVAEISRGHGLTPGAVHNRAKRYGWSRDLTKQVRERVRAKLVTDDVSGHKTDEIIESASTTGAAVIKTHRKDIAQLQALEQRLIAELGDPDNPPQKVHVTSFQGVVTLTQLQLTVSERSQSLQALANVQHKRIQLQRQAFNLDEESGPGNGIDDLLQTVYARSKPLVDED